MVENVYKRHAFLVSRTRLIDLKVKVPEPILEFCRPTLLVMTTLTTNGWKTWKNVKETSNLHILETWCVSFQGYHDLSKPWQLHRLSLPHVLIGDGWRILAACAPSSLPPGFARQSMWQLSKCYICYMSSPKMLHGFGHLRVRKQWIWGLNSHIQACEFHHLCCLNCEELHQAPASIYGSPQVDIRIANLEILIWQISSGNMLTVLVHPTSLLSRQQPCCCFTV